MLTHRPLRDIANNNPRGDQEPLELTIAPII
jgi:hypothetical protein